MHTTTHTKNAFMAGVAIAIILLTGSCYWNPQSGAGKITVNLDTARGQVSSDLTYARVYLYADNMNSRINIGDGTPYVEAPISGGSVTVDHVPAGNEYKLVVTFGTKQEGVFVPQQYAWTEHTTFDVTAGHQTNVGLSGKATTVNEVLGIVGAPASPQTILIGKNLVGVATDGNYVGATSSGSLFVVNALDLSLDDTEQSIAQINSISYADIGSGPEFWLNTVSGIEEYYFGDGVSRVYNLPVGPGESVLSSGGYQDSRSGYAAYFRGEISFGGVIVGQSSAWQTIRLSNVASGELVLDFSLVDSDYGYFATKVGAFDVDGGLVSSGDNGFSYISDPANAEFYTITKDNRNLFVTTLATDGSTLFLGTADGVYYTNAGQYQVSASALVDGTASHPYRKILFNGATASGGTAVAVSNNVLVVSSGPTISVLIPLPALALGDPTGIALDPYGNFIVVSGTGGLSYVLIPPGGWSSSLPS